jgi:hypothetical protein
VIPAVFEDSYRADKITIVLPIGKDWSPLELDVSVKNVKQRWDEVGRTQKGHTPNRSFSSLIVHYNDMTYEALIVHISNINQVFAIDQMVIDEWLSELGVYTENRSFRQTLTHSNYRLDWNISGGDNVHQLESYGVPLYTILISFNKME